MSENIEIKSHFDQCGQGCLKAPSVSPHVRACAALLIMQLISTPAGSAGH